MIRLAAALGFVGVALGAFGAHGLRERLSPGRRSRSAPTDTAAAATAWTR